MATKKSKDAIEREKRREASIAEVLTSKDFYSTEPALSKKPDIVVCWGQRSNGKTYGFLKEALETYKKSGRTFVYVRRWAEDISVKNMDKLMSPLPVEQIFGQYFYIKFFRGAFWLRRYDEEADDGEVFEPVVLGWAIALNQVAHTKSQAFPGIKIVILDEFLQLKSERILRDEFDAWEQTLSTVLRTTNDALIVLLGNSVSKYSPYFTPYGIDINQIKQGEIKVIDLPNEKGEPTKVVAQWCEYNPKIGARTSKYVRGSKMAKTGEWEIAEIANIPHTDNEIAKEQMLCSMYDYTMGLNLGIFVRYAKWFTLENINGIYTQIPHEREFLVIRQTPKRSSYYHLTNVKDLTYASWTDLTKMWRDIEEQCEIDILNELVMGRVYAEDAFTADYFYHCYLAYIKPSIRDLL